MIQLDYLGAENTQIKPFIEAYKEALVDRIIDLETTIEAEKNRIEGAIYYFEGLLDNAKNLTLAEAEKALSEVPLIESDYSGLENKEILPSIETYKKALENKIKNAQSLSVEEAPEIIVEEVVSKKQKNRFSVGGLVKKALLVAALSTAPVMPTQSGVSPAIEAAKPNKKPDFDKTPFMLVANKEVLIDFEQASDDLLHDLDTYSPDKLIKLFNSLSSLERTELRKKIGRSKLNRLQKKGAEKGLESFKTYLDKDPIGNMVSKSLDLRDPHFDKESVKKDFENFSPLQKTVYLQNTSETERKKLEKIFGKEYKELFKESLFDLPAIELGGFIQSLGGEGIADLQSLYKSSDLIKLMQSLDHIYHTPLSLYNDLSVLLTEQNGAELIKKFGSKEKAINWLGGLILHESNGGKLFAVSPTKYLGLGQIGKFWFFNPDKGWNYNPFDLAEAIAGVIFIMNDAVQGNDIPTAFTTYNAGGLVVAKAKESYGSYWRSSMVPSIDTSGFDTSFVKNAILHPENIAFYGKIKNSMQKFKNSITAAKQKIKNS